MPRLPQCLVVLNVDAPPKSQRSSIELSSSTQMTLLGKFQRNSSSFTLAFVCNWSLHHTNGGSRARILFLYELFIWRLTTALVRNGRMLAVTSKRVTRDRTNLKLEWRDAILGLGYDAMLRQVVRSAEQSVSQTIGQSINPSIRQSLSQSINQTINQ